MSFKNLKPETLSAQGMMGVSYPEPRSGQITLLVNKQIYTLSVFIICSGLALL